MIEFDLDLLAQIAKHRPEGYVEAVIDAGRLVNGRVQLTEREYLRLRRRYSGIGLGDVLAVLFQPVARLLDRILGTRLAGCRSCAQRQRRLNRWRLRRPRAFGG